MFQGMVMLGFFGYGDLKGFVGLLCSVTYSFLLTIKESLS